MLCENEYCIYQKSKKCMLDTISIDEFGRCSECIVPNFPYKALEKAKEKTLKKLELEDKQISL